MAGAHLVDRHLSKEGKRVKAEPRLVIVPSQDTESVAATLERRGTARPQEDPLALTTVFSQDPSKQTQWKAFLGRVQTLEKPTLRDVVERLRVFLGPSYRFDRKKALVWSPAVAAWRPR
jgi:hypothetical protein